MVRYRIAAIGVLGVVSLGGASIAADLGGYKDGPVGPIYAPNVWTGFYVGAHVGGTVGETKVSDPYGPSIFGDAIRTPGGLGGGQIGYNFQMDHLVAGLEADVSAADLDGTNTCFAFSGFFIGSNCHAHVNALGTLTARLGTTVGPSGRTLFYVKGGAAWENIAFNARLNADAGLPVWTTNATSASETKWGWTVGAGIEHALSPRWSVKAEYNYLDFGNSSITSPGSWVQIGPFLFAEATGKTASFSEEQHVLKVGVNYKLNGIAGAWDSGPASLKDAPAAYVATNEIEIGTRYARNWSRFQKDLGQIGLGDRTLASRLIYDNMPSDAGELFARVDTASNFMVKGYIGIGSGDQGRMHDEDWMLFNGAAFVPYSNTVSEVQNDITYGAIDVGYDIFRSADYKVAPFVGYAAFKHNMKAFGCVQIANPNSDCIPSLPTSTLGITEKDTWQALRVGAAVDIQLTQRLKLSAEAAYLPYVSFSGTDNHVLRDLVSGESGKGLGAQFEASLSYALSDHVNVGIGGRYSTQWTTSGDTNFGNTGTFIPMKYAVEQAAGFAQLSYKFSTSYELLK
jgi:opacity protein-like surface antigen